MRIVRLVWSRVPLPVMNSLICFMHTRAAGLGGVGGVRRALYRQTQQSGFAAQGRTVLLDKV